MNEQDLKTIVDHAVALHRETAAKSEQLEALKAELVKEALRHPKAPVGTESGGRWCTTKGSDGCSPASTSRPRRSCRRLKRKAHSQRNSTRSRGDKFRPLFSTVKVYQLAKNSRAEAKAKAEAVVKLCEIGSAPRVSFEVAS